MAIGTQTDSDEVMSEINMIPFIDVMLVLLIIFIITVPVIKHSVNIELPQASMEKVLDKPENIRLSVDADGVYYWNDQRVEDADFANRLTAAAAQDPQPELHIRGDKAVRYERVAQAMASAQRSGVRKIGFITEPSTP
jgi:biopolymer transport protein ExbD